MDESAESNVVDELERRIGRLEAIADDYLATLNRIWLLVSEGHSTRTPRPKDEDGGGDDILSQFERRHYNNGDVDDGEETDKCCICLERLHRGLVVALHCHHKFHGGCIGRWLRGGSDFCPLCKARAIK